MSKIKGFFMAVAGIFVWLVAALLLIVGGVLGVVIGGIADGFMLMYRHHVAEECFASLAEGIRKGKAQEKDTNRKEDAC